jgi:hypothetical protein
MALTKTIRSMFPGAGLVTSYGSIVGANTNTGATTIVLNTNTSTATSLITPLMQAISNGRIRVKGATIGTNSTSTVGIITATDGTTTLRLYAGDAIATTAGVGVDEVIDFCTNLSLNSFSVVITTAVNNCTHDVEIAGNL